MDDPKLPADPSAEFLPPDPVYRRLHRAVRFDPDSVWEELEAFLRDATWRRRDLDAQDLVEDLMFWHGDAFIDRVEGLVGRWPATREIVAWAVVEGVASDGVSRFHDLQHRLRNELEADRARRRQRIHAVVIATLTAAAFAFGIRAMLRRG